MSSSYISNTKRYHTHTANHVNKQNKSERREGAARLDEILPLNESRYDLNSIKYANRNGVGYSISNINAQGVLMNKQGSIKSLNNNKSSTPLPRASPTPQPLRSRRMRFFAKLIKLMFSNIGLIMGVFLYSTLGALMFQLLERHEELRLCEEGNGRFTKELKHYREEIKRFVIYNMSSSMYGNDYDGVFYSNSSDYLLEQNNKTYDYQTGQNNTDFMTPKEKHLYINQYLIDFRKKIIDIEAETKYSGQNCTTHSRWNFFSSLLFTITVISTVGYGYVAPITWEGRVVCICYASIGIPIFLLCLANLSSSLGHMFTFIYTKIDSFNPITRYRLRKKLERRMKKKKMKRSSTGLSKKSDLQISNLLDMLPHHEHRVGATQDGLSMTRSEISSNLFIKELDEFVEASDESDDESDDDDEDDDDEYMTNEVPFYIVFFVIVLYFFGGAWIFVKFEDWNWLQSIYFAYVTLSTMGFGDLVPGLKENDPHANIKLLTVCFYSLFGMATLGMCFNAIKTSTKRSISKLKGKVKKLLDCARRRNKKENFNQKLIDREKEREDILSKIKMLQMYENQINAKRRKKHVLN